MTESPVTLITGGSTGIGATTARKLIERGHRVAVTARRKERLDAFAESVGEPDRLLTIPGDAAEVEDVRAAVASTLERFGRIDTVIANAGYATFDSITDGDPEGWRHMVLTNVFGPMLLVNASLPALRESRGRIVMVGSVAGFVFTPGNVYGATKWAVTGLAENTRRAVTDDGIGVTLVAPGRVETNFWETSEDGAPAGLNLTEDQMADTIVFAVTQPAGVDVNTLVVRPIGQPN